uniref:RxLR effector candidate protein n=1 Tax=Hyaloperonospora arabidopsidis (strain Emoy2) TaxID=559515 RepID=M4B325_HYAAE
MRATNIFVSIAAILCGTHGETLATAGLGGGGGEMSSALTEVHMNVDQSLAELMIRSLPLTFLRMFPRGLDPEKLGWLHNIMLKQPSRVYGELYKDNYTSELIDAAFQLNNIPREKYNAFLTGYESYVRSRRQILP